MAAAAENPKSPLRKWPAESEIEAYRKELEVSFLQEEATLEAKRREVIERLDLIEQNTLSQAHAEIETLHLRRNRIIASLQTVLEERFATFLLKFHGEDLVEELARDSMVLLCPKHGQAGEGAG